jgi:hypothetical protein
MESIEGCSRVLPVAFIHIPKTAGTSLGIALRKHYKAIASHYPPDGVEYDYHPDDLDCVMGHFAYGFSDHVLAGREAFKFTFLREPKNRFISQLNYDIRYFSSLGKMSISDSLAISEVDAVSRFVEENELLYFDNCIVRYLSGRWNFVPMGALREGDLDRAKENLMRLDFVGDMDSYESDVRRLGDLLGFQLDVLGENRGGYVKGEGSALDLVVPERFVEFDVELYRFYREYVRI